MLMSLLLVSRRSLLMADRGIPTPLEFGQLANFYPSSFETEVGRMVLSFSMLEISLILLTDSNWQAILLLYRHLRRPVAVQNFLSHRSSEWIELQVVPPNLDPWVHESEHGRGVHPDQGRAAKCEYVGANFEVGFLVHRIQSMQDNFF